MTVDAFVYTAILGMSALLMLFFGGAGAFVALIGIAGAAWGSPRIAAPLVVGLRRWLGRR